MSALPGDMTVIVSATVASRPASPASSPWPTCQAGRRGKHPAPRRSVCQSGPVGSTSAGTKARWQGPPAPEVLTPHLTCLGLRTPAADTTRLIDCWSTATNSATPFRGEGRCPFRRG